MQEDFFDPPEEFDTERGRFIHYGYIASGNQVFESGKDRDQLVKQFPGLLCLEREALGLIALFPGSLHVVQGVCNLGDLEQPDHWRRFSASAAAAYVKDFISSTTDLDQKYKLDHISSISYALAVDLNCLDSDDPEQKSAVCLLADRNMVQREYGSSRSTSGMTFYPLAFHLAYGNFTSLGPPWFF
ncbi:hypothetical protein VE03_10161 [Pseudogymnoascus sp. 23342-1-I1]|nr:hypothetical protein VE03_10161 [Pseudogymnoascus sp. 23342-1-I1]